ncbi:S41 family peptidase [Candidatus Microgenomates bacterium]|nr:S41 family peptidase [Candidatus Microgenomates bacterium]
MYKIQVKTVRNFLFFLILGLGLFGGGFWLGQQKIKIDLAARQKISVNRALPPSKQNLDFTLFWEVWDKLQQDYLIKENIDPSKMVYGAIRGMVEAVGDPYTTFLPPSEQKRTREDLSGSFEGVGIEIGFRGTQLAVIAPLAGTPAQKSDVRAGDYILFIKDEGRDIKKGTVGLDLISAVEAIRGPAGTTVTLTLAREDVARPFEVNITRQKINIPSVTLEFVGEKKNIAHLKLSRFGDTTNKEWNEKVGQIVANKDVRGIVLDVRNNPGGYLTGAISLASEFVRNGTVVIQEDSKGNRQNFPASGRGKLTDMPVAVLISKGSASASEILAGALRDNKRAKLVGETSFGKGTIQEAEELSDGAGLHITTAKWLTPNGTWVHEKGLEPDIKVEDKNDTEIDEQLNEAVKLLQ